MPNLDELIKSNLASEKPTIYYEKLIIRCNISWRLSGASPLPPQKRLIQ